MGFLLNVPVGVPAQGMAVGVRVCVRGAGQPGRQQRSGPVLPPFPGGVFLHVGSGGVCLRDAHEGGGSTATLEITGGQLIKQVFGE